MPLRMGFWRDDVPSDSTRRETGFAPRTCSTVRFTRRRPLITSPSGTAPPDGRVHKVSHPQVNHALLPPRDDPDASSHHERIVRGSPSQASSGSASLVCRSMHRKWPNDLSSLSTALQPDATRPVVAWYCVSKDACSIRCPEAHTFPLDRLGKSKHTLRHLHVRVPLRRTP